MDSKVPAKTAKITSLENLYAYCNNNNLLHIVLLHKLCIDTFMYKMYV